MDRRTQASSSWAGSRLLCVSSGRTCHGRMHSPGWFVFRGSSLQLVYITSPNTPGRLHMGLACLEDSRERRSTDARSDSERERGWQSGTFPCIPASSFGWAAVQAISPNVCVSLSFTPCSRLTSSLPVCPAILPLPARASGGRGERRRPPLDAAAAPENAPSPLTTRHHVLLAACKMQRGSAGAKQLTVRRSRLDRRPYDSAIHGRGDKKVRDGARAGHESTAARPQAPPLRAAGLVSSPMPPFFISRASSS